MQAPMMVTHDGQTLPLTEWAKRSGVKHVTLYARIRNGVPFERAIDPRPLKEKKSNWYKVSGQGARNLVEYEHRIVAERAMGKPLPKRAEVHHVDENPLNNAPQNLVICPDHKYHALLHLRARALREAGNANFRKCVHCQTWDAPENLKFYGAMTVHRRCHTKYHAERREKLRRNAAANPEKD